MPHRLSARIRTCVPSFLLIVTFWSLSG